MRMSWWEVDMGGESRCEVYVGGESRCGGEVWV